MIRTIITTLVSLLLFITPLHASDLRGSEGGADIPSQTVAEQNASAVNPIVGTYTLTITPDGETPFPGLATFFADGTALFSAAGPPIPALGNPGHGVWVRTGPSTYAARFQQLTFDTAFQLDGRLTLNVTIHVDGDGEGYDGHDSVSVFDVAGTLLFEGGGVSRGVRMHAAGH